MLARTQEVNEERQAATLPEKRRIVLHAVMEFNLLSMTITFATRTRRLPSSVSTLFTHLVVGSFEIFVDSSVLSERLLREVGIENPAHPVGQNTCLTLKITSSEDKFVSPKVRHACLNLGTTCKPRFLSLSVRTQQ